MGKRFAAVALVAWVSAAGAQGIGTFPEFEAFYNTTPGPFIALGVYTDQAPERIQKTIQPGSGAHLEISRSNAFSDSDGWAEATYGTNRAYAAVHENQPATFQDRADAISLWKDRFTLSGSGATTFQVHVDGTLGPGPVRTGYNGASVGFYYFGVYRVSDGTEMAYAASQDFQGNAQQAGVEEHWRDASGALHIVEVPPTSKTPALTTFDISLPPYLAAGTYEIRSSLFVSADVNDVIHASFADYAHTASFESATLLAGVSLSSASGLLVEQAPGKYGYAAVTTPVPEPEAFVLMIAGMGLLGWKLRRRRVPG